MLVKRTNHSYDLDKCLVEWEHIHSRLGKALWKQAPGFWNQTCLQHSNKFVNDPYSDGAVISRKKRELTGASNTDNIPVPSDFIILNEVYEDTVFADVIRDTRGERSRVMIKKMHTTYSVHIDKFPRYHLALITNPNAYFIFPTLNEIVHIPDDGFVYEVDTTIPHSFVNCGEDRTHLVISKGDHHVKI